MPILSQDIPNASPHLAIILQLLGRRREIEFRRAGYNTELSVPLDNIPFSTSTERERIEETVCSLFSYYYNYYFFLGVQLLFLCSSMF